LAIIVHYRTGLTSFLAGEPPEKPREELRTEQVPSVPVESWEELRTAKYDNVETAASSKNEGDQSKKEREKKKKKTPPAPANDSIDVSKLDIRVGVIQKAWEHPEADKLFCEEIDIGEESGPRQIASGLKAHYNLEDLEGQRVLVLANLKSRKLVGFPSHGMVLCASDDASGKVKFVEPPANAKVGERVFCEGFDGEPATENQVIKKKMLEAIFPDLKTNGDGVACYKNVPLCTSAGECKAELPNAQVA
jgi:aminoacyl tRNA synthase complex-interacting multifunctional protein 1